MAITVQVPVVVEMTGEQVSDYAAEFGLQIPGYRTKDIVDHVREWLLADLKRTRLADFAEISIKGRA